MNEELVHINNRFIVNKLSLNTSKTNYILFSSHRKQTSLAKGTININNIPIPHVASAKFLGIYIDRFLTWNDETIILRIYHVKLQKNIGILSRIAYLLSSTY